MGYDKRTPYYTLVPTRQGDKDDNVLSVTPKGDIGVQRVAARPHQIWHLDLLVVGMGGTYHVRSLDPVFKGNPFAVGRKSDGSPLVLDKRQYATEWRARLKGDEYRFFWVENPNDYINMKFWYWHYDAFRNRCYIHRREGSDGWLKGEPYLLVPTLPLPVITKADCSVGTFGEIDMTWWRELRITPPPRNSEYALPAGTEVRIYTPKQYNVGWFWNNGKVLKKGLGWTLPAFGSCRDLYGSGYWDGTEFRMLNGGKKVKDRNDPIMPSREHRIHTIQYWHNGIYGPPAVVDYNNHQGMGCSAKIENNGIAYW